MATVSPGDRNDLIGLIMSDHRAVEGVFAELIAGAGDAQHRRALADHLTTELVRHSVSEELYLYPAARRALPDGDQVADREIEEHADVERILKELEGVEPADRLFDDLIGKLYVDVQDHVTQEERDLLPRLREVCDPGELQELGELVARTKAAAPTRPHPSAPDRPPRDRVLASGTGMIDRLRDALTGGNPR
ncbi:hemerythrin domain-containing protein [Kribbella sp. NPDC003557]|uniref:hemerythrin domain-containing protein n=1 Tax=Kribbella sp. NPDC003557 TaxID=3154449 RepID=UPI0033B110AD